MKGEFDFDKHALKRIDYIGVTFRTRTAEEVREINRLLRADLWPALEAGKLSLPIYKTYPLAADRRRARRHARQYAFRQDRHHHVINDAPDDVLQFPACPTLRAFGINLS